MTAPFVKNNIYGCSECSKDILESPVIEKAGGFIGKQTEIKILIYACPVCKALYISINDNFLEGSFEDIVE